MQEAKAGELTHIPGSGYVWLLLWFVNNIGLTLMNKAFFVYWGFLFPISLSALHMWFSALLSVAYMRFVGFTRKSLTWRQQGQLIAFSVLFCSNIIVGNLALQFTSVSLVQVIRSVIPGFTMILSILLLHKQYSLQYRWSVFFIIVGVALASIGEAEFNLLGFGLTLTVCLLSSMKSVLTSKFMVGELSLHEFDLLAHMSLYAAFQMSLLAYFTGEFTSLAEVWWPSLPSIQDRRSSVSLLFANGVLAFFLNLTNFLSTKKTSALTVTIAGNVKHVATIAISIVIFNTPISTLNAIGTIVTILAVIWYSYIDYQEKRKGNDVNVLTILRPRNNV